MRGACHPAAAAAATVAGAAATAAVSLLFVSFHLEIWRGIPLRGQRVVPDGGHFFSVS